MGAEYKVHTKLLTEFETLEVMGENCSGIIMANIFSYWIINVIDDFKANRSLSFEFVMITNLK